MAVYSHLYKIILSIRKIIINHF